LWERVGNIAWAVERSDVYAWFIEIEVAVVIPVVIIITIVITSTLTILALTNVVLLCVWTVVYFKSPELQEEFNLIQIGSDCQATFSAFLLAYLVYSYMGLRWTLSKIFSKELPPDFVYLSRNFAIVVVVFGFNFFYMCAYGHYHKIICKMYIRWILKSFF